jgi:hypothetical protein
VAELLLTLMAGEQKALMGGVIFIFHFPVSLFSRGTMSSPKAAAALGIADALIVVG